MSWYIRLFGQLELERGEQRLQRFRTTKTGLLVAYLALTPPHRCTREFLADLLWGDDSPERARHSLNMAVSALRHALDMPDLPAGQLLLTDRTWVALNADHFTTDVMQFEQAMALASRAGLDAGQRQEWWQRAVTLYRGELLAGCYEPWAVEAAARYHSACLDALRQLLEGANAAEQVPWLHRLLQLEPLDWQATERLVTLYLAQGQVAQARQVCAHYEAHWQRLYPEPPPHAFTELQRRCTGAHSQPAPVAASPRGVARPRKQSAEMPPAAPPLPRATSAFYGRARELEQLATWLVDGTARLVTLTGLGGIGKTRLALEFARRVQARNALPVWWADLQAVPTPELLWNALPGALGLPAVPDQQAQVLNYLARTPGLLILDNFEQLLPEGVGAVETILQGAAGTRLLITSRVPLELAGEYTLPLAPLALGAEGEGMLAPAVQLFADRAERACPDFRLTPARRAAVEQLCRRLDGIPLALELAAARAGVLSPQQMLERLDDRLSWLQSARRELPARHRSLQAVLDACAELLDADARAFWLRLAVFRGDFTLDAAQAICPDADASTMIEQLIAAGLLQSEERGGTRRLRLLETLREYAARRLAPEARSDAQHRLLNWTLSEAGACAPHQFDQRLVAWLAFWDAEREQLLEALHLAQSNYRPRDALQLLHNTRRYWMLRALHRFAEATVEQLLPHLSPREQGQARLLQAEWAAHTERFEDAHTCALQALALDDIDPETRAWAHYYAVHAAIVLDQWEFVQQRGEQAVQYALLSGDATLQIAGRRLTAWYNPTADLERAPHYSWFQTTTQQAQQLGDPLWIACSLHDWIDHCQVVGRYEESLTLLTHLGAIADMLQDGLRSAEVCRARAYSLMQLGRLPEAETAIDESLRWTQLSGSEPGWELALKANLRRLQGDYDTARKLCEQAEGTQGTAGKAFTLEIRGLVERDAGALDAARRYLDRAIEQRRAEGNPFRLHFARTHRAHLGCRLGEPNALSELQACLAFWHAQHNSPWIATTLLYLAEAQIAAGDHDAARESLLEALERNRAMGRRLHEMQVEALLATLTERP